MAAVSLIWRDLTVIANYYNYTGNVWPRQNKKRIVFFYKLLYDKVGRIIEP